MGYQGPDPDNFTMFTPFDKAEYYHKDCSIDWNNRDSVSTKPYLNSVIIPSIMEYLWRGNFIFFGSHGLYSLRLAFFFALPMNR